MLSHNLLCAFHHLQNSSGAVMGIKIEAVNGTKVTNVDALTTAIVRALGSGTPYSGTFETEVIEATWKDKTIADGPANDMGPRRPVDRS